MRRAVSSPPDLPGYEYVRPLGSGGFSDVFLYRQRLPRREVAVKVLLVDQLDSASRERFVAEANVMAQLSTHPYIVTIFHADVASDDRPYFVMEYCPGPSLAERYKRGRFEVADALRTGIRLAGGIATAHAVGILHRDIKPGNVLTNGFGWPALTDFGISSTLEGEVPSHTTTTVPPRTASETGTGGTESVGMSVPWSPPEMFADNPKPDVRSDVFSLAATIHTLLAGRTPFEVPGRSNGTLDIVGRIERGAITPFNREDLPRSLTGTLRKAMAPRRSDRFDSAIDFARALQRVELELGYSPTGIEVPGLDIPAAEPSPENGGDETRLRSVATVLAQPGQPRVETAPTVPSAPAGEAPAGIAPAGAAQTPTTTAKSQETPPAIAEQTLLRAPRSTSREPAGDEETPDTTEPSSRHRPVLIGVVAAAVIVVAAAIVVATLVPHSAQPGPTSSPSIAASGSGGGGGISVDIVPTPIAVAATPSADGTSATFTWKNPHPQAGDSYEWTEQATNSDPVATSHPTALVTGITPGTSVCIDIVIVRSGRASANPLKECTA